MPTEPKFNSKRKAEYLQQLREGLRRGAAAEAVGISRETARLHYNSDETFAEQVRLAEADSHEVVEDALFQAASSGNVTAMIFYLCNRMPEKWQNVQKVQNTHAAPDGGPMEHRVDMKTLTDDQLRDIIETGRLHRAG
jgi:hypothetical protein